jgi:hypothetical protein
VSAVSGPMRTSFLTNSTSVGCRRESSHSIIVITLGAFDQIISTPEHRKIICRTLLKEGDSSQVAGSCIKTEDKTRRSVKEKE